MFAGGRVCNDNCILWPIVNRKTCFEELSPPWNHEIAPSCNRPLFLSLLSEFQYSSVFFQNSWRTNLFPSPLLFEYALVYIRMTLASKSQDGWLGVTQLLLYGRPAHGCTLLAAYFLPFFSFLSSLLPSFFPSSDFTPGMWIICPVPCCMHFNVFLSVVFLPPAFPPLSLSLPHYLSLYLRNVFWSALAH